MKNTIKLVIKNLILIVGLLLVLNCRFVTDIYKRYYWFVASELQSKL